MTIAGCNARVAGAQGGFCREKAVPGSDYCETHAPGQGSRPEDAIRRALPRVLSDQGDGLYEWDATDEELCFAGCPNGAAVEGSREAADTGEWPG